MAILPIDRVNTDFVTLTTHPARSFTSGSSRADTPGTTGEARVFPENTTAFKSAFEEFNNTYDEGSVGYALETLTEAINRGYVTVTQGVEAYVQAVNLSGVSKRYASTSSIERNVVVQTRDNTNHYDSNNVLITGSLRKGTIVETLFPAVRNVNKEAQFNYINYHTLNFFTSSEVSPTSCIIYPAPSSSAGGYPYRPSGSFTFQFYINPRYTTDTDEDAYQAGTILHMSSTYAISIVTGSQKEQAGKPSAFRLMLQLSSSADIPPSLISLTGSNNAYKKNDNYLNVPQGQGDLIFLSSDNSLKRNNWHHVAVRWSENANGSTGSFVIDNVEDSTFIIPSASCTTGSFEAGTQDPLALFVGNYFAGNNSGDGNDGIAKFFNSNASTDEGVTQLTSETADPDDFGFTHPLNAEIHELRIYDEFRNFAQIYSASISGSSDLTNTLFYVPPFFVKESRERRMLRTPGVQRGSAYVASSSFPHNLEMSFRVGALDVNLENFTREFVKSEYPRLFFLTSSVQDSGPTFSGVTYTGDQWFYNTQINRKRNLTILPCDNGKMEPDFSLLKSGTISTPPTQQENVGLFVNDLGDLNLSRISLNTEKIIGSIPTLGGEINTDSYKVSEEVNSSPLSPGSGLPGSILGGAAVFEPTANSMNDLIKYWFVLTGTADNTSNEVCWFDIPYIYYGNKIEDKEFFLQDTNLSGSGGKVSISLRDDGKGGIYRADALTEHAKWNAVGTLVSENGIAFIKSPHISKIGKEQFSTEFSGSQNLHVLEIMAIAPQNMLNSSSNPDFLAAKPNDYANETATEFTYVTNVNFHDENLNVIAKANLSQPVVKRPDDDLMFRVKYDF